LRAVMPLDEYERRRRQLEQKDQVFGTQEELLAGETERHHDLVGHLA
jgi:hypothetical protein